MLVLCSIVSSTPRKRKIRCPHLPKQHRAASEPQKLTRDQLMPLSHRFVKANAFVQTR